MTFNRRFKRYEISFMVQDIPSSAKERNDGYKYNLYVIGKDDVLRLVSDRILLTVPKFKTIREAHRWTIFNSECIELI